eukprot:2342572-Pyramimonas_sp.AAC.1
MAVSSPTSGGSSPPASPASGVRQPAACDYRLVRSGSAAAPRAAGAQRGNNIGGCRDSPPSVDLGGSVGEDFHRHV